MSDEDPVVNDHNDEVELEVQASDGVAADTAPTYTVNAAMDIDSKSQAEILDENVVPLDELIPADYHTRTQPRPSLAATVQIPEFPAGARRLSAVEMDEMKTQIEHMTNDLIVDPEAAARRYSEMAAPENNNSSDIDREQQAPAVTTDTKPAELELQKSADITVAEALARETRHVAHPSLVNQKLTWRRCLSPYHLLRLGIAAGVGIACLLIPVALAYALNPNICVVGQSDDREPDDPIDADGISNQFIFCFRLLFFTLPCFAIFGREWLWTARKLRCTMMLSFVLIFLLFLPAGLMDGAVVGGYGLAVTILCIFGIIFYVFFLSGWYVCWMLFPFVVAFSLSLIVVLIGTNLFEVLIDPSNPYTFPIAYSVYILVLQAVAMKFHLYSLPYKCGGCCTCCWNKGKSRKARTKNATVQEELSDRILFWYSMVVITVCESLKIAGYTSLQEERGGWSGLYSYIFYQVLFAVLSRNAVMWEILYRVCLRKEPRARSRIDAIYYGARNQGEFIPIWMLLLMNLVNFGPRDYSAGCTDFRQLQLSQTVNIFSNWWMIPLLLVIQAVQIGLSELMLRLARACGCCAKKNDEDEDPPRKVTLVEVHLIPMAWILVHCYVCAYFAFDLDNEYRFRQD